VRERRPPCETPLGRACGDSHSRSGRHGAPGSQGRAIRAPRRLDVIDTHVDIVGWRAGLPTRREGGHGASGETRSITAALARARALRVARQNDGAREGKRAAVGVPQAVVPVNQHAKRRAVHRFALQSPAAEGIVESPTEREECQGVEAGGDSADDFARPVIERMGASIATANSTELAPYRRSRVASISSFVTVTLIGVVVAACVMPSLIFCGGVYIALGFGCAAEAATRRR